MIAVTLVNLVVIITAVMIHYECLLRMNLLLSRLNRRHRFRIVLGVLGAMAAHALEVWCFALTYYLIIQFGDWGSLKGEFDGSLLDCAYFSFTTFTTIGFGDIHPVGHIKFLTGLEALTGLMLITWTASFLFLEMQKYWKPER
ncbi:potassium channel family protein [Pseudomonas sp.]|uniref:potassium channel family protein n=1 Tax=Pseudomonas sp. TaxID=306 RepID=UPI0026224994|nr:potassium channel family protein [Pseudomonas sp.]